MGISSFFLEYETSTKSISSMYCTFNQINLIQFALLAGNGHSVLRRIVLRKDINYSNISIIRNEICLIALKIERTLLTP